MKRSISLIFLIACTLFSFGQKISIQVTQPDFLKVDAGRDTIILSGGTAIIGGKPAAANGFGNYLYSWEPVTGLNDPTLPNPNAAPVTNTIYRLTVTDGGNCIGQDEVTVTVNTSSIRVDPSQRQISVYPNPAVSELFVEIIGSFAEADLRLFDAFGKLMLLKTIRFTNQWKGALPIENLVSGYYFLSVIGPDGRTVVPVIIIK